MTSIRVRLLKWLVGPIVLVNLAAALLAYQFAWKPAELAFDQSLFDAARAIGASKATPTQAGASLRADGVDAMWFALHAPDGKLLDGADDLPLVAGGAGARDGMMRGEPVRIVTLEQAGPAGVRRIDVARTVRARERVREAIVRALVLLEVAVCLALAGLAWFSVTNGLAPLARLRASLDRRGSADLTPLPDDGFPNEIAPLVGAFNGLLGRIEEGARAQHQFQANVAHQLRTPLAGLKLQIEWLAQRHHDDPETRKSASLMLRATETLIRETNQLLSLARAEQNYFVPARLEPLDLADLIGEAVQAFVDQARARRIDLGFELASAPVRGDRFLLRDLLDNLVDNALRYTPPGGNVTVSAGMVDGAACLVVEDNGPGIPASEQARIFDRFVRLNERTTGSGLGLAIVRDIARVHQAQVRLDSGAGGCGAAFTVVFPT